MTLYGFANDTAAKSTCYGACANAWPPVTVADGWAVGAGLDSGPFSTVARDDGTRQLVAGKWPLYEYVGDASPGDINGQGSGGVWFAVAADGTLIK
jgi:predicted lipoprotein with Yx(FWY)xxD motif